jgi:hypothetical protein
MNEKIFSVKYLLEDTKTQPAFVYFGLTQSDIDRGSIEYEVNKGYTIKGVNTTLEGLKRFKKDHHLYWLKWYTILPIDTFCVDQSVDEDKEYDFIAVKLPFKFKISKHEMLE